VTLGGWVVVVAGVGVVLGIEVGWGAGDGARASACPDDPPAAQVGCEALGSPPWALAASADGRWLATATIDGEVRLRDLWSGESRSLWQGGVGSSKRLTFSPESRWLAVTMIDGEIRLWDLDAGTTRPPLAAPRGGARFAVFLRGPTRMVVEAGDARMAVHTFEGELDPGTTELKVETDWRVAAGTPDGGAFVTGDDSGAVAFWDVPGRRTRWVIPGEGEKVLGLAVSPDGSRVAVRRLHAQTVPVLDAATGETRGLLDVRGLDVMAIALSTDGRVLATVGLDGTLRVFDAVTGRIRGRVSTGRSMYCVTFSHDGHRVWIGGADALVREIDVSRFLGGDAEEEPRLATGARGFEREIKG
jgi:WD40 repeat protein